MCSYPLLYYSLREEIIDSVDNLQVFAGHEEDCEAAGHAMTIASECGDSEAVLTTDAANAFNSVNSNFFLRNIRIICPYLSNYIYNCYSCPASLFIIGDTESSKRATQCNPAARTYLRIKSLVR